MINENINMVKLLMQYAKNNSLYIYFIYLFI